jgi:hypothetical protein
MSKDNQEKPEEKSILAEPVAVQPPIEVVANANKEVENLPMILRGISPLKISVLFLAPGILSLLFSVIENSQVLAFIGLGLTFWGALFLLVRPLKYVEGDLLDSEALSEYLTIDRITKDLKQKGHGYYVPSYPEEAYLPEHLKGLKEMIVFISTDVGDEMPSLEAIAKGKFLVDNPKGICISPPGLGLLKKIEKELKIDITKLGLSELCETIPQAMLENLRLAKNLEMTNENTQITVKIQESLYTPLYQEQNLRSVHLLGCPLASAIACAVAKTTGKVVSVQKDEVSPDGRMVTVWLKVKE